MIYLHFYKLGSQVRTVLRIHTWLGLNPVSSSTHTQARTTFHKHEGGPFSLETPPPDTPRSRKVCCYELCWYVETQASSQDPRHASRCTMCADAYETSLVEVGTSIAKLACTEPQHNMIPAFENCCSTAIVGPHPVVIVIASVVSSIITITTGHHLRQRRFGPF